MKFEDKLKARSREDVWNEYCGFLDLSMDEFVQIQNRLMEEQIALWSRSPLGKKILKGSTPKNIKEFRGLVPLTSYDDYASDLLQKKSELLPDEPVLWIQTTWEGGKHPIKVAPYTESMLDTFKRNVCACLLLGTSTKRGDFKTRSTDTILYGLAPLPYATGLLPLAFEEEIGIEFLPPVKDAVKMSFSTRNKVGFKLGLSKGIDYFFGLGSVTYYVSLSLGKMSSGGGGAISLLKKSPLRFAKIVLAKCKCIKEGRELKPKDIFKLKGFMVAGTDNACYKDDLEELWGIRPMEIFAGTEPTCIGTETWSRNGLYFFPDACFYEFIPSDEMEKNLADSSYQPRTVLINEVEEGMSYELVISVLKGGAFMRYRVGDMYQCIDLKNKDENIKLPRFKYLDRVPNVIDIGGFTRITENSIDQVVKLSGLKITNYIAKKEFNHNNRPYLHLYVEMDPHAQITQAISIEILREQLSIYFKYVDQDYQDLKKILGIDPLKITIIKAGTFAYYEKNHSHKIKKINPPTLEINELLTIQDQDYRVEMGGRLYE